MHMLAEGPTLAGGSRCPRGGCCASCASCSSGAGGARRIGLSRVEALASLKWVVAPLAFAALTLWVSLQELAGACTCTHTMMISHPIVTLHRLLANSVAAVGSLAQSCSLRHVHAPAQTLSLPSAFRCYAVHASFVCKHTKASSNGVNNGCSPAVGDMHLLLL